MNLSYLSEEFTRWYDSKFWKYGHLFIEPESGHEQHCDFVLERARPLIEKLGMTERSFYNKLIKPYVELVESNRLDIEGMEDLTKVFTSLVGHHETMVLKGKQAFGISVYPSDNSGLNALDWVLSNVEQLKLDRYGFELKDGEYLDNSYGGPIGQCLYCGKMNTAPYGEVFGNKYKYCHICNKKNTKTISNPSEHIDCCYGKYALLKKTLIQSLKRNHHNPSEIKELFTRFCDTRFTYYLNGPPKIRKHYQLVNEVAIVKSITKGSDAYHELDDYLSRNITYGVKIILEAKEDG